MDVALRAIDEADDAPSVSRHVERDATLEQVLEFLIHRSAYQLKEADPHSWAIPRLSGAAEGRARRDPGRRVRRRPRPERIHAQLFADAMDALGSTPATARTRPHPRATLATVNLMSLCGLHRRLRGAIVGHLALFEMTSSIPNRRYATGLRRLGLDDAAATEFFDEHVEADAVHEAVAAVDLGRRLARSSRSSPRHLGAPAPSRWTEALGDTRMTAWEAASRRCSRRRGPRSPARPAGRAAGSANARDHATLEAMIAVDRLTSAMAPSRVDEARCLRPRHRDRISRPNARQRDHMRMICGLTPPVGRHQRE
jgi:hypothetical protein